MVKKIYTESDYIPLNMNTIHTGDYFGVYRFKVSPLSHTHHIEYLKNGNQSSFCQKNIRNLYPFEMYSLPRVLSILGGFKRLNEIVSVYGERKIICLPQAGEELFAEVIVKKVFRKNGIVYGYFLSNTKSREGKLFMTSFDKTILLNQTDKSSFKKILRQPKEDKSCTINSHKLVKVLTGRFIFRHKWDESVWVNNIHVDSYAQSIGFKKALIEAPSFIDIIFSNELTNNLLSDNKIISWDYTEPLYEGLLIDTYLLNKDTIYVCHKDSKRIIMTVKIKEYEK